jgi:signal transduction histidine kinase
VSDTASSRRNRLLTAAWISFAAANIVLMYLLPGEETIPFHFVWISLSLVYGFAAWPWRFLVGTVGVVTVLTAVPFGMHIHAGTVHWTEATEIPLMAAIFLVMVWHVWRRQVALREVQRHHGEERRQAQARELFVRLGSHELRTPITVARGFTELIRSAHPDPQTDDDAGVILDELGKLSRITDRLVTLLQVAQPASVTLVDLDREIERIMRRWAPAARRRWEVEADAGIVGLDMDRWETALDSLLDNAVKFTRPGDTISVRAWRDAGDAVVVEVADTGDGIAPEDAPYVFDALRTGTSSPDGSTGTGLGLAIVRSIVASRGGEVTFVSAVGEGTTFVLRFPARPPSPPTSVRLPDDRAPGVPTRVDLGGTG